MATSDPSLRSRGSKGYLTCVAVGTVAAAFVAVAVFIDTSLSSLLQRRPQQPQHLPRSMNRRPQTAHEQRRADIALFSAEPWTASESGVEWDPYRGYPVPVFVDMEDEPRAAAAMIAA